MATTTATQQPADPFHGRAAVRPHEAAKRLGVHERTLRNWARMKKIRVSKIGGVVLVPVSEIRRLLGE